MAMAAIDKIFFFVASICLLVNVALIGAAPESALVSQLPGFHGSLPSKHYSGYVTIVDSAKTEKNLFYYFVVSERNPSKDPVVLWLNGGPGCSSLDGFIYEHGKSKGRMPILHLNPYSWSKVSNVLYLDSPAGVGFSYSKNTSLYITGDKQTASDTQKFLLQWFQEYPEFVSNPFFVSGESYAGVYVPTLSAQIVNGFPVGIKSGEKPVINFKGYMVGNGVTDEEFDGNALVPFTHGMSLISDKIFELVNDINIYDILEPCFHSPNEKNGNGINERKKNGSSNVPKSFQELGQTEKPMPVRKRIFGRAWPFRAPVREGHVPTWPEILRDYQANVLNNANADSDSNALHGYVPCTDDEVARTWLNNAEVNASGAWELCSDNLDYSHDTGSMIPYHKNLTMQGFRALIYSGDHDMCVPYTGSQAWTSSLGYKTLDEWRPWTSNDQVAGYLQGYDHNLTFLTIKGAGHTVPEYKPRESLDFYSRWLEGKPI
ncbi:serine carboxypeptidase-like 20 [Citrus sinensis]|uniref:Serine carboxypeptidase-like 20 n=1 Tax=Citrus sinensis TaxID=2711 RepID=A0ACB8JNT5_CITSI|nr:serine carboxypeptidase-like 20 [Citrus sinensis]